MQIYFKRDAFLQQLFPRLPQEDWKEDARVAQHLRNAYSRGGYTPEVSVEGEVICIQVDEAEAASTHQAYERAVQLAQRGQYAEAKAIIEPLLEKGSQNAELYRTYGQILAEEGDREEAMNHLIEALKWDPKLTEALIMMGNLYAEGGQDFQTAQVFYEKVMELEPENYLALNNIGGVLAKSGQLEPGIAFFQKALEVKPDFPNALHGIALARYKTGRYLESFEYCTKAMKAAQKDSQYKNLARPIRGLMIETASSYAQSIPKEELYNNLQQELENETGRLIEIQPDESIPSAAKLEVAEYKHRETHRVLYKSEYSAVAHLIMHELIHLELIAEARAIEENQLFTSGQKEEERFRSRSGAARKRLAKAGLEEARIEGFMDMLFNRLVHLWKSAL